MAQFKKSDIVGETFGRLLVTGYSHSAKTAHFYKCKCECGTRIVVMRTNLRGGNTKSCGCIRRDSPNNLKHGLSGTFEHRVWKGLHTRCTNPKHHTFKNYGGRGIEICARWKSFEKFLEDMGPAPAKTSIDRINIDGNYEPSNCRWATLKTQARNKRSNRIIEIDGIKKCLMEWCEIFEIPYDRVRSRLDRHPNLSPKQLFALTFDRGRPIKTLQKMRNRVQIKSRL